ncbi:MAG: ArgE/DapE family deacylase [Gemmatimonadetes bacterium]|nr:ArgE/DapE family deacylase [Gemmatimonadota bacterium]
METSSYAGPLAARIAERQEAMLAFARDLIRIPTENPPGNHYPECVDRIVQELSALGLGAEVVPTPGFADRPRASVLSFHGSGPRTLYFHGHYDVVPAQAPDLFEPRMQGGRLAGRGSADMKAGLALMIYATAILKELGVPLGGRIGLCIVPDEETGGQGGSRWLDEAGLLGRDAVAMVTPEPTSGVVWNANRGAVTLRVSVKGKPAHVGLQHQGVNAFERMVQVVTALQRLKAEVETRRTSYRIDPPAAAHSILLLGGRVEGGTNFNVVPDHCAFTLDRRFNPEEDFAVERGRVFEVLEDCRRAGIDLEVETLQEGWSAGTPEDHPVARALAATIASVTGSEPAFEMCPGLLENRWYARRGIPAFAYGPGFLALAHGPHESVRIADVVRDTLTYALLAIRLLPEPTR